MAEPRQVFRIGCDVGGTFTDFVLLDETTGEVFSEKCLTTPVDPSVAMLEGLRTPARGMCHRRGGLRMPRP